MSKRRYIETKTTCLSKVIFFLELEKRINNRIKSMLDRGLIDELRKFHDEFNRTCKESEQSFNYTRGIFQAIGFKEFHDYLLLSDIERKSENGEKVFNDGR
jgi:tRNA A37 N6-isopentenylltransferase MiaA